MSFRGKTEEKGRRRAGQGPKKGALRRYQSFRWEPAGHLVAVAHPHHVALDDLLGIDHAKAVLVRNTRQFAHGLPANNALLWGSRGTGKSSLVKAVAAAFAPHGLKLVEIGRDDLLRLPLLLRQLRGRPHPFLLFCDDLSFEAGETSFKPLKALLEGSVEARPENVLLYATSNRRHLLPRTFSHPGETDEVHPEESAEERISLSDRFGLWLGFHPFSQETYLTIVRHHAARHNLPVDPATLEREALDWARVRGARSGRVAWQFITDLRGRLALPPSAMRDGVAFPDPRSLIPGT